MKNQKITSMAFLCFSILTSIYNIFLDKPWVCIFTLLFIPAVITKGKISKYFEFISLVITSICAFLIMNIDIAMIFTIVLSMLFYSITTEKAVNYIFIAINCLFIFIVCLFKTNAVLNRIIYAALYSGMYFVISTCCYLYMLEIKSKEQEILPLDPKIMNLIDGLSSVAHESIDALKKIQEGKNEQ